MSHSEDGTHPGPNPGAAILPAILAVIGAWCLWRGVGLGFRQGALPGAGFMPVIYGILLLVCAVPLTVSEFRSTNPRERFGKPLLLAGVLLVTIAGFTLIGGVASLFLMMLGLFVLVERLPPLRSVMVAGAGAVLFWAIFVRGLSVALPTGPWGF